MKLKNIIRYIAGLFRVSMILIVFLLIAAFAQEILLDTIFVFYDFEPTRQRSNSEDPNIIFTESEKKFLFDGTVHLLRKPMSYEKIYDVNGKLIWENIYGKKFPFRYLDWAESCSYDCGYVEEMQVITAEFSRVIEMPMCFQSKINEVWRYEPREDFFVGYKIKGETIGYIGADGFSETKSHIKPFGKFDSFCSIDTQRGPFNQMLLWRTDNRIYQIDFENRKVDIFFESIDNKINSFTSKDWLNPETRKYRMDGNIKYRPMACLKVGGENTYNLILREPEQKLTVTIPSSLNYVSEQKFTATEDNIFFHWYIKYGANPPVTYEQSPSKWRRYWYDYSSKPHKEGVELYKVKDDGQLSLVNHFEWTTQPYSKKEDIMSVLKSYIVASSPISYDLIWNVYGDKLEYVRKYHANVLYKAFSSITGEYKPTNKLINYIFSVIMLFFTLWHGWARRTTQAKFILWLVFIGLFNLAGFLTYLALNHTAVIKCPACGKKRNLERCDCVRCGDNLPKISPKPLILSQK